MSDATWRPRLVRPEEDRGSAWLYVFAAFMIRFMFDGFMFSIGVFHEPLYEYFGASNAATSVVASILFGVDGIAAPFATCLVNRFGCKNVSVCGSLIATASLLLSTAMPRIEYLYITIGLLCGFGIGLMDFSTVAMIGAHFDKKRATVMGIVFSGSGFGSLMFAPLIGWLNQYYGSWKGSMVIVSGLILNCTALSLLYSGQGSIVPKSAESAVDVLQRAVVTPIGSKESTHVLKHSLQEEQISSATQTNDEDVLVDNLGTLSSSQQREITFALQETPSSLVYQERSRCMTFKDVVQNLMDVSVFGNPVFLLFNLGCVIFSLVIRIPFVYIPHRSTELGIATTRESSYLMAVIGVSNTLGRLVLGTCADKTSVSRLSIFNACLMVNGLANLATSLITCYYQMAIYGFVFGFTFGVTECLAPVVLVDLLGIKKLNTSYGLLGVSGGISIAFGTPLAGFLHDKTQTYEQGFYVAGGIILISCLVLLSIPIVQRRCPPK